MSESAKNTCPVLEDEVIVPIGRGDSLAARPYCTIRCKKPGVRFSNTPQAM